MTRTYKPKGPKYCVANMSAAVNDALNIMKRGRSVQWTELVRKYSLKCASNTLTFRAQQKDVELPSATAAGGARCSGTPSSKGSPNGLWTHGV